MTCCVHCGAALGADSDACLRCGSRTALADPPGSNSTENCASCGESVAASWRCCGTCGTPTPGDESRLVRTSIAAEARGRVSVFTQTPAPTTGEAAVVVLDTRWPAELHR